MKNLTTILGALLLMSSTSVNADGHKVKVGMITTLSGGGSGLGIDVRDGFMLAVKNNKNISNDRASNCVTSDLKRNF